MRSSFGTWAAWTPFFDSPRYKRSQALVRKLTITSEVYRVSLHDTKK
jgi:hypothetical protein